MSGYETYDLHLLPCVADVAVLRHEAHDRYTPLAWIGALAVYISWNGGLREIPYLDAFSLDLSSPDAATVFVEGVTEGAIRSVDTATSSIVVAVGAEDVAGALLSCHGALVGVVVQSDLVPGEIADGLNDVDLRVEVTIMLVIIEKPADASKLVRKREKVLQKTTHKAGHMPQALAGRCSKSAMIMPLSMVS